ncbi:MAG: peptidoglycan-binding domain-containing protein [Patescibacteria group bacterium]
MKKIIVSSAIALTVALVGAASVNAAYNANLSVGSTGADVSALQAFLISKGFSIPAISSGAATPGYFGSQTKSAVVAYQASVSLPNTGFVGPLTRGVLNGTSSYVAPVAVGCPIGYTCTANPGTVVTLPPAALVMDGTDGSITSSLSSYAGNSTIKKGETKDMVAVKLQATAAPVSVTRFDVRFNTRPWLYFGAITLKDSAGNVIATKNLTGSADATEITTGSDYLVRFEGVNIVITPGSDKTLVVTGSVLATTDKLTSDVSVIVSVPNSSIRTINGKGYTDSIGLGTVATSGTSGRTVTLSSTGSTGNILGRLSPTSPDNRIQTTSTSGEITGVVLGKFDFKSENRASTLNTLTFTLKDNGGNRTFSTMFKRLYITDGSQTVQVDSVATSSVFSSLTFALPQDTWKTFTILADVADQDDFVSGAMASSTITVNATNIVGIDSNFTTVTASGANAVTTNNITFLPAGASVTTPVVVVKDVDNGTSASTKKTVSFAFAFNNTGTTDLYLTTDPYRAVATSSTIATTTAFTSVATTTVFSTMTASDTKNGDTTSVFIVNAGTSRTFTIAGLIDTTRDTTAGTKSGVLKLTKVYFGDDTTNIQESNINFGLDNLTTGLVAF